MLQKAPAIPWVVIVGGTVLGIALLGTYWSARHTPNYWDDWVVWAGIPFAIFISSTSLLFAVGKVYQKQLNLPPLDEKYKPQTNQIFLIFGVMGFFKLVLFLLGWD